MQSDQAHGPEIELPSRRQSRLIAFAGPLDVASVAQLLMTERPTFHAFEYRGRRLLYDLNTGVLLETDSGAHALFLGVQQGLEGARLQAVVQEACGDDRRVQLLLRTVLDLAASGLFSLEELDGPEQRDRQVDSYLDQRPRKMMLLIQSSCNLACTYCYEVENDFHATAGAMPFDRAKAAVDSLIERSGSHKELEITFFGGEPLLNFSGIRRVVTYAKAAAADVGKSFHFQITTNGVLLTPRVIDYLLEERFSVMVSFDGDVEQSDTHRLDTRGRGVGAQVLENIDALIARQREAGLRVAKVRATLSRENPDAARAARFFAERGWTRTSIGASMGRADHKNQWDLPWESTPEQRAASELKLNRFLAADEAGAPPPPDADLREALENVHRSLSHPRRRAAVHCGVGRNMLAHTARGALYPCHRYAGEEKFEIGSVERGVDREKLEAYYRGILSSYDRHCSSCWARNLCGGQCAWYISRRDGSVGDPDEASCDALRGAFEKHLWLYGELLRRRRRPVDNARMLKEDPSHDFGSKC